MHMEPCSTANEIDFQSFLCSMRASTSCTSLGLTPACTRLSKPCQVGYCNLVLLALSLATLLPAFNC